MRVVLIVICGFFLSGCDTLVGVTGLRSGPPKYDAEQARIQIAEGNLILLWPHHEMRRSQGELAFEKLVEDRLSVHYENFGYCELSASQFAEVQDFNRVMTVEIERRFGVGILDRLRATAAATQL